MENKFLLTIAIPTYNRALFLDKSLDKICKQIVGFEDCIELLVSDNCSTDNTKEVVLKYINKGFQIVYNKNHVNLGMDGNFIYCFENAKGEYVWLLGDDDFLDENTIPYLISNLRNNVFGLIHLKTFNHKNENKIFTDKTKFLNEVSYWMTFISANIVNRKYVSTVDFNKYKGSYFTLIPVYLNAVKSEKLNLFIYDRTMAEGADFENNGGYNVFQVFVTNYLSIIIEYIKDFGYRWYEIEKYRLLRYLIWPWMKKLLIEKNVNYRYSTESWFKILFKKYWYEFYFYPLLIVFVFNKMYYSKKIN